MRGWRRGPVVGAVLDQPEDADHLFTVHQWHRADLYGHPCSGGRNEEAGRISGGVAEHLPGEQLAGACLSSGATTEAKWRPRTSPTSRSAAGLSQRTTPLCRGRSSGRRRSPSLSTSPPTPMPVAITEVWLIGAPSVIVTLSNREARRSGPLWSACLAGLSGVEVCLVALDEMDSNGSSGCRPPACSLDDS